MIVPLTVLFAVSPKQTTHDERMQTMGCMKTLGVATALGLLVACSNPQDRAAEAQEGSYQAQEKVAKERLELVNKYQACIKDAGADQQKAATCEGYLKAAEALK